MPPRKRQARPEHLAFQVALGELIRAGRKPSYNQDDFADRVGVYRSHMGLIEQGKLDLRLSTLLAVAEALDLPLSTLIGQVEARLAGMTPPLLLSHQIVGEGQGFPGLPVVPEGSGAEHAQVPPHGQENVLLVEKIGVEPFVEPLQVPLEGASWLSGYISQLPTQLSLPG